MQSDYKEQYNTGAERDSQEGKPFITSIDRGFWDALIAGDYEARYYEAADAPRVTVYQKIIGNVRTVQTILWEYTEDPDNLIDIDSTIILDLLLDTARLVVFHEWPPSTYVGLTEPCLAPDMLWRFGAWLSMGASHYGDNNWRLGIPASRVMSSLFRHVVQWAQQIPILSINYSGPVTVGDAFPSELLTPVDDGDDHAAAILFNIMVLWVYLHEFDMGNDSRLEVIVA